MRTILIADRDPATVARLRQELEPEGYRILAATDAEEALALLRHEGVDLLILDTLTEGFPILERRESPTRHLPVIMMGADIPEQAIFRGWELGVDTYQSKNESAVPRLAAEIRVKVRRIFDCGASEPNSRCT